MIGNKLRICFNNGKFAVVFALALFFCSCGNQSMKFEGTSMLPAIKDGETIYLNDDTSQLKRGDIIAFHYPKDTSKTYVKRIIGLPGETVEISEGKVYINGSLLPEPYIDPKNNVGTLNQPAVILNGNNYFVLGDNRDNSSDSRAWGLVSRNMIYGIVVNNK